MRYYFFIGAARSVMLLYVVGMLLLLAACSEPVLHKNETTTGHTTIVNYNQKAQFATALAKAVENNSILRAFIKDKALEQFDNDYDLLYALVKDEVLANGLSFRQELLKYFESEDVLTTIERDNPMLTIYVPELPSNFSAETWNTSTEAPKVAVAMLGQEDVSVFGGAGKEMVLTPEQIPGFPVLVLKESDRVVCHSATLLSPKETATGRTFHRATNGLAYSFADASFDGSMTPKGSKSGTEKNERTWFIDAIPTDVKVDRSRTVGVDWHRDYVYYSLEPGRDRGKFDNRYKEYITMIRFASSNSLYQIADADKDPKPNNVKFNISSPSWTDGIFELRITVLINAKNGVGQVVQKVLPVRGDQLFHIEYVKNGVIYVIKSITPKEYWPHKLDIAAWSLENYGTAWKFTFEEFDLPQTITEQFSHTSKFATNFGFDAGFGETVKIGLKFGINAEETKTQTYTIQTMVDSDKLGECIVDFGDQIITGFAGSQSYPKSNEYSTGTLFMSLEPLTTNDELWNYTVQQN